MSVGRAERMVGTIKRAVMESVQNDESEWRHAVLQVLYGYCRRGIANQLSLFQPVYGVSLRISGTESGASIENQFDEEMRESETFSMKSAKSRTHTSYRA